MRIVFLDRDALRVPLRAPAFPHEWVEYPYTPREQIVDRLRNATIAIINRTPITAETLNASPGIRLVAVAATGYDVVDVKACTERGVSVCNVRDWSVSLPEHIFALILSLRRQLSSYTSAVKAGDWSRSPTYNLLLSPLPRALAGSTLGLIGLGAPAQRVATIAAAFGMTVVVAERKGATVVREGRLPFEEVLKAADVLVVLCPLSVETRGLIGAEELELMKREALLVNSARGGIVDERALAEALRKGEIAGAGVDVLAEEPPRVGGPLMEEGVPNLIITPHVAWASVESLAVLADKLVGNLEAFVAGTPRSLVRASD